MPRTRYLNPHTELNRPPPSCARWSRRAAPARPSGRRNPDTYTLIQPSTGRPLLALVGRQHPLDEVGRYFLVVAGLDVEIGPSAGDGAQVAGVGEHLYLGHLGLDR